MFLDTVFRWEFFSHPRAGLRPRLRVALNQVRAWHETYRQRRTLLGFDDAMLKDIGISRVDALQEGEKPFWRP
ncbi:MAG: DUF1127 domain-containing protein [Candidatus Competibacteraceae bacterium]|nr:DUF1127 domain-containing protein [Candidatus Competibacteraceae bacterium]MBK7985117.1 DUF1127 domain-containing protein [Candidatus Competibacteraceae bacterium]MBK9953166.1 DUF1127 domain-containing protein [Candidatus Competibacteraceae bacterium]